MRTLNYLKNLGLLTLFLGSTHLTAQTPIVLPQKQGLETNLSKTACGVPPMTDEQIRYTLEVVARQIVPRNAGTTCIPIQAHIVRNDDGTGGITIAELTKGLANLNYVYQDANIEFYWKGIPTYANNTDYVEYNKQAPDSDTEAGLLSLFTAATNAVNVYYVNSITNETGGGSSGYAYYPANATYSNTIVMVNSYQTYESSSTFVHEFGHYFNLAHTFNGTENGNTDANAENVPRSGTNANCSTKGDFLCDTHADPRYGTFNSANCTYTDTRADVNGVQYTPPVTNKMSYFDFHCGINAFTPEQYNRIMQALTVRLAHTAYSLNAAPEVVNNPSGLTATQSTLSAVLNWADNATNDMGYLIERSTTSSTSGFKSLLNGGTAPSATTFTDATTAVNTTYYYRIKAANDNCNDYSNVVTITIVPTYCTSTYTNVCYIHSDNVPISLQQFNLATLGGVSVLNNPNNGCLGAVSNHTSVTNTGVTAGTNYTATATLAILDHGNGTYGYFGQSVGIWLDINNDKDFDDANEFLGNFTNSGLYASGQITIPATSMNGNLRLRVRSGSGTTFTSTMSCSSVGYGEAEDYTLTVSGGTGGTALPVELLTFDAVKMDEKKVQLTWETASEVAIRQFVLESSIDGKDFQPLAQLEPQGSLQKGAHYAFVDVNPFHGVNYYRLCERTDKNDLTYLGVRSVVMEDKSAFKAYPNPTTNDFELHFYAPIPETVTIQIIDIFGRNLTTTQQEAQEGSNFLKMAFPTQAANGWYTVHLQAQGRTQIARIKKLN
jgi:GEVED domain/Pregnancy-associated plasma protein-A